MRRDRLMGKEGEPQWTLSGYAWRGPRVKSPLGGPNIRAVVAIDSEGRYHPGLRNFNPRGPQKLRRKVFEGFTLYRSLEEAIKAAHVMLVECLDNQMRTQASIDKIGATKRVRAVLEKFGKSSKSPSSQTDDLVLTRERLGPHR